MFITYLIFFLPYLVPVLLILVAAVFVWKYFRTKDVGLLWLAVAVVIWPLVSREIEHRALLHFGNPVQGRPWLFPVPNGRERPGVSRHACGGVHLSAAVYRGRSFVNCGALSIQGKTKRYTIMNSVFAFTVDCEGVFKGPFSN